MPKKVYGVGINDVRGSSIHKKEIYTAWYGMLTRCFSESYKKRYPTYAFCTVDPEWLRFSAFHDWAILHYRSGMHLDKDILIPGNKHYSSQSCVFIPHWLNSFVSNMKKKPRDLPMGVNRSRGRFGARFGSRGTGVFIGSFETAEQAGDAYMAYRIPEIKKRITAYQNSENADCRVVSALIKLFFADECSG